MKMAGHETEAIYRRYAIRDRAALELGSKKLSEYMEAQRAKHSAGDTNGDTDT